MIRSSGSSLAPIMCKPRASGDDPFDGDLYNAVKE